MFIQKKRLPKCALMDQIDDWLKMHRPSYNAMGKPVLLYTRQIVLLNISYDGKCSPKMAMIICHDFLIFGQIHFYSISLYVLDSKLQFMTSTNTNGSSPYYQRSHFIYDHYIVYSYSYMTQIQRKLQNIFTIQLSCRANFVKTANHVNF